VLRELGVELPAAAGAGAEHPAGGEATIIRRADGSWTVQCSGASFRLRDTKGLRYLAELIEHPGAERHVLDLVELADPTDANGSAARRHLGDAGPAIDARAKATYRQRIEELREQAEEAQALEHFDEAAELQRETDALVHELAQALGLGGRDRRAASAAERARLNVTRAIRAAIARIEQWDRAAGRALDQDVSTGCFCSYAPTSASGVRWRRAS
jgi:hypothetical protein